MLNRSVIREIIYALLKQHILKGQYPKYRYFISAARGGINPFTTFLSESIGKNYFI